MARRVTRPTTPQVALRWSAPSLPAAVAALLAPPVAVLQSKAMAPLALLCLAAILLPALLRPSRLRDKLRPMMLGATGRSTLAGAALLAGLALGLWGAASALWAPEAGRALGAGLSLAALVVAAGLAAGLVARDAAPHRRALGLAVLAGLVLGLGAAGFDDLTGNGLRAAVRGLKTVPPELAFGLKPAASVMALLLPLLAGAPLPLRLRGALLLCGGAVLLALPGDTAKLAALAGLGVVGLTGLEALLHRPATAGGPPRRSPRLVPRLLGIVLGFAMLGVPALLGPAIAAAGPGIQRLPPSAVHRLVIWDFGLQRAAEHPVLGWGMEASRALPGGKENPAPAQLDRLQITRPDLRVWFAAPRVEVMPLHPHNGPLQVRLELGWVGSILAAAGLLLLGLACARLEAPAAAAGTLASGFVTFFASFGAWQGWWLCSLALALVLAAGLLPGKPPATLRRPCATG
jgi:O-antigen ligase